MDRYSRIRVMARLLLTEHQQGETAAIRVNKPYKPRRLKMDPAHRLRRLHDKRERRKSTWKQHHRVVLRKYMQKFGKQLKRRTERVRQIRHQRHLK